VSLSNPQPIPRSHLEGQSDRTGGARFETLWVAGSLAGLDAPTVAIVGTRAASAIGRRRAYELAATLGRNGVCVISGLAVGIDAAAHEGAIEARAPTIGVLGGGHRQFFPSANRRLAEAMIATGGAVVSGFAPDHPALPFQFLQRNAIVATLADAVVVVEAATRSGALNTAAWAADLARPVLAFPGEVERAKIAGCLNLIRDGDDVLAALPVGFARPARTPAAAPGRVVREPLAARIVDAIENGDTVLDAILARIDANPAAVLAMLTELELLGDIARDAGSTYSVTGA